MLQKKRAFDVFTRTIIIGLIKKMLVRDYPGMFREAGGDLAYPFLTPGSESYADVLWDWDSWFSDVALRQVLELVDDDEEKENPEFPFICRTRSRGQRMGTDKRQQEIQAATGTVQQAGEHP